jgi:hypothetical protein
MSRVRPFGLLFLCALFLGVGFHLALGDYLLFLSDWQSLAVYLGALALAITPFLLLAVALCRVLAPRKHVWMRRAIAFIVALVVAVLALELLSVWLIGLIDWPPLSRILRHPFYLAALCLPFAVAAVFARRRDVSFPARVEDLGLISGFALIVLVASAVLTGPKSGSTMANGEGDRTQLVVIVLDGMPAQYLPAYNDKAGKTALDPNLKRARVFTGVHTSAAWTNGYFGTLYTGSERVIHAGGSAAAGRGLFSRLQLNNIGVRWLSYHRNGFPEGSAAKSSQYVGLRSYLLMERFAWIPEVLGLNYHIALSGSSVDQNLTSGIARWIYRRLLGGKRARDNVLPNILLPQLRKMRSQNKRSLVLFHMAWARIGPIEKVDYIDADSVETLAPAQQRVDSKDGDELTDLIRQADYRYGPELESFARSKRRSAAVHMKATARHLANFLEALDADPALRKTAVIVTADHGHIYGKGRFWYGFHPNVEVVRVPFILFNASVTGRDDRLFATPDLHHTILDYFGIASDQAAVGRSIFGEHGHDAVATLTMKSDRHKEWFLVVTTPSRRYRVNLHPKGDGLTAVLDRNGYESTVRERTSEPPPEIRATLPRWIARYGIEPADIHPTIRALF